jgi:hypothetical protein
MGACMRYLCIILTNVLVVLIIGGGQDSSVGIATCCGLYGLGIEFCWGEIFCTHLDLPQDFLYSGVPSLAWRLPPTTSWHHGVGKGGAVPLYFLCVFIVCFTFYL